MDEHDELLKIFLDECKENIDLLDQEIVNLESQPDDRELLDNIFRAFHTLKGNAGIVGMNRFGALAHITEEVLTEIRDGKRQISSEVVTFLLDSLDQLKVLHKAMTETGSDEVEIDEVLPPPRTTTSEQSSEPKEEACTKPNDPQSEAEQDALEEANKQSVSEDRELASRKTEGEKSGGNLEEPVGPEQKPPSKKKSDNDPEPPALKSLEKQALSKDSTTKKKAGKPEVGELWNKGDSAIRVDVSVLDDLMDFVGELVLSRNQILQFSETLPDTNFDSTCQRLDTIFWWSMTTRQIVLFSTKLCPPGVQKYGKPNTAWLLCSFWKRKTCRSTWSFLTTKCRRWTESKLPRLSARRNKIATCKG